MYWAVTVSLNALILENPLQTLYTKRLKYKIIIINNIISYILQQSDPDSVFGRAAKAIYATTNPDIGIIMSEIKEGKYAFININHPLQWAIDRHFSLVRGKLIKFIMN